MYNYRFKYRYNNNENENKLNIILKIIIIILILFVFFYLLFKQLKENFESNDPILHKLKFLVKNIDDRINDVEYYVDNKSYTINKKKIYMCLKDKNGKYYDTNSLMYVLLHELAHVICKDDIGHTDKFFEVFDDLLYKAYTKGIYNPSIPMVQNYCMY